MDSDIKISITKDALSKLPIEEFPGRITVINTDFQAEKALEILEKETMVGFDTETRPSFRKGVTYNVALIQISTASQCFLFRINLFGITDRLRRFIENEKILKIGLSLKDDFTVMHRADDFMPAGFLDLQNYVKRFGIIDSSLQKIYGIVFNMKISKAQRLSNWEAQHLSPAQQLYASLDAWACLRLYKHFEAGNFKPEESTYIVAEHGSSEISICNEAQ